MQARPNHFDQQLLCQLHVKRFVPPHERNRGPKRNVKYKFNIGFCIFEQTRSNFSCERVVKIILLRRLYQVYAYKLNLNIRCFQQRQCDCNVLVTELARPLHGEQRVRNLTLTCLI